MIIRPLFSIFATIFIGVSFNMYPLSAYPGLQARQATPGFVLPQKIAQIASTTLTATGISYLGYLRYVRSPSDARHLAALACIFIGAAGMIASDAFGIQEPLSAPLAETNDKLATIMANRKSKPIKMWPYNKKF